MGKTTLFTAMTRNRQGEGKGSSVGVARVPDFRVDKLAEMFQPHKITPAEINFSDPPTTYGSEDMFTGKALEELQKMDALLLVIRSFEDASIPHVEDGIDLNRDLEKALFNVSFADIAMLDKRIGRLKSGIKGSKVAERSQIASRVEVLKNLQQKLEDGGNIRTDSMSSEEIEAVGDTFLLGKVPVLVVFNIGENDIGKAGEMEDRINRDLVPQGIEACAICARLEMELAEMSAEEEAEMRRELEAPEESGLDKVIALAYRSLGLISFLTSGKDEVRAWPVRDGSTAVQAAGKVHSDIARGFIRAEIVSYDDFVQSGSLAECRKNGLLRREGRDYMIKDGDIANFLFSV